MIMYKNVHRIGHYMGVLSVFCTKMYTIPYFPIISGLVIVF